MTGSFNRACRSFSQHGYGLVRRQRCFNLAFNDRKYTCGIENLHPPFGWPVRCGLTIVSSISYLLFDVATDPGSEDAQIRDKFTGHWLGRNDEFHSVDLVVDKIISV